MSYDPSDDAPYAEWIVYDEIGAVIGRYGQDACTARITAQACGGADRGIHAIYKETSR